MVARASLPSGFNRLAWSNLAAQSARYWRHLLERYLLGVREADPFDASTGNYLDNIVVFAVPVALRTA